MMAAYNYKLQAVVIGAYPYPDELVPYYGSSYSQEPGTPDTPSLKVIKSHFYYDTQLQHDIGHMIRESWRLLAPGYFWVNAIQSRPGVNQSSVRQLEEIENTIAFIAALLDHQYRRYRVSKIRILTFGREAAVVASSVTKQLHGIRMRCTTYRCAQPAQLSRVTYNRHLIGCDDKYTVLTPNAVRLLIAMVKNYRVVQGHPQSIKLPEMPQATDSLITSGIKDLSQRANDMASAPISVPLDSASTDEWKAATNKLVQRVNAQTGLVQELVDMISTNAFVSATIQDRMIGSVAAMSSLQGGPPARPVVVPTSASSFSAPRFYIQRLI